MTANPFSSTLLAVQSADEDFEWYPTTDRMIDVVARRIPVNAESIMDIGAGDGRVLRRLGERCEHAKLYAIEKSLTLLQAQPENIIPVGTDLLEQNLACLPVDFIFCNPPYSEFELWTNIIVESGHAKRAFLVIPRRWSEDASIRGALERRGATATVIGSDDFFDGVRRARAVVDIVEIHYPLKDDSGYSDEVADPFDTWFDQNISTFEAEDADDHTAEHAREQQELARIRALDSIPELVEAHDEEYARMEENYRAIFRLDYALLKELGVSKFNVRDGIKVKMAGLKSKYWSLLFERLDTITSRLSTRTKAKFLEKLTGRSSIAFTESNAYAIAIWAIKNANQYFAEQTVQLFRDLSTFDGVRNYKSNLRAWEKHGWRYQAEEHDHYALDYRFVVVRYAAIFDDATFGRYDYPGNLYKGCHELIADVRAVLNNLGFVTMSRPSVSREWTTGEWQNWYIAGNGSEGILFQVKAHKNGNLHFRFLPDAIKALNVEAGRLLGWLHSPAEAATELGIGPDEARRFFGGLRLVEPSRVKLLAGSQGAEV